MRAPLILPQLLLACLVAMPLAAQDPPAEWRITNAGVLRADSAIEAVFHDRTLQVDTVAIADFASHLLARLGVPPFEDSLAFRVTADSMLVRITGRLMDFPVESRQELGPIFSFIDSTTPFTAEIGMPQHADGIMRFRLERVRVAGFSIPELLLLPALREYDRRYPVLAAGGRELLIAMPPDGEARLIDGGIVIWTNGEKREARGEK
ncbi:MAG: hypothetical protein ABI542_09300 [Gemmatimonadota bacterium]